MSSTTYNPANYVSYGPDTNCTLAVCPLDASVLGYRPAPAASGIFLAFISLSMIIHAVQGIVWRHTLRSFAIPIIIGCIDEIIGYAGRVVLYNNPFSFNGFIIQIVCITTAPVFICASIYVTLARTIEYMDAGLARFHPKYFYWFFIPCDIVSLVFQAAGGALSSITSGGNQTGVNLSLFGLAFQVFTLAIFIGFAGDYLVRYFVASHDGKEAEIRAAPRTRLRIFLVFLTAAVIFILVRCIYRIDELSDGYTGPMIRKEGLFYGLESVMITLALLCLNVSHPGFGLKHEASSLNFQMADVSSSA
ncbi:rta1 domain protein [Grosmannia clavigera kw1407]|uniref:Rta1 domain protein n=1 Tax=Grosmannia clavigera (strain kw1407 / UAMH 11150) TaxID=655863 RepID=F0XK66_GROCL|nr:rta1 domain protein [Grosmannia clavigera kw1407]EFX01962.1 rta1 domain protein [Grosmannia clavigera kw1407]